MTVPLAVLLELQSGVIARRQAFDAGLGDHDIKRMLRRREWATVHPGVYVDHTGPLPWLPRAWAAVLSVAPAALSHASAVRAGDGPGRRDFDDAGPVHVAVDRDRNVCAPDGVVVHRVADLESKVIWNASPPRFRIEHAAIDVAAQARDESATIAVLARAVQARRTTALRLLDALATRSRIARRTFMESVLHDVAEGSCSALEHSYLTRVERAHGLPTADRQVRESARGPLYRDVVYRRYAQIVELDGRLFHDDSLARDADLERDLDAALLHLDTVRLGWGQAHVRACMTAIKIGTLLQQRGWTGHPTACARCRDSGGVWLPGGQDPPLSA